ncbi:unnamed protein product [Pieris macdunnoughi]|uniref:Titin homolog n=1 Tax=Pieris macdunnoughi TaxID=345717 RepID=A0A821L1N7_9NEOP|nr:unnamed protein product [Pieris macdunnoughi]
MEAPAFPRTGVQTTRAAPGSEACIALPLPIGTPPFTYEWSRAGATLDGRFRTSVDAGGVRLTVSSAQIDDSGVYTLQASNAAGKDTTRVSLEVSPDETPTGDDPPTFLRRLQDLTVKVGTRTRFLVEILSSTECRVTWYRNERRLLEAERIALVRDGNFWCADVATVTVDDAGRWTCTAENLGGRASCSAHLNVLVPKAYKRPEFVEELRAILTEQGTVSLECKVIGVPTPVLRWFKDSREIKAGDVFALTANADDPTSLGTYTCEAINCMGRAYSSSKVHVIGRAKEGSDKSSFGGLTPDPPPIFTKELEDQFVRICDHLSLGCQIVVPPWPRSVVWYNKEGKIDSSTKYHIIEDGVGGYMIEVSASEWADEGEWKCVATSAGGRVGISTCSVTMDVPKNYRKPRFMENLQAILTEEGLVSFECKVVGFPTPILSWFKDGQELKPGDVYQLTGTNSLGSYCCIARNCMGQASSSAELTVEDIQNQLNEEEKLQLFSKNQAPKFLQGLKSVEVKIDEPFRFTIKVVIPPEPTVLWYRDDQPMDESPRCHLGKEDRGVFFLDIKNLELMDQTEWKCVAMNDYGHSVTSCFLKLIIPRHYKKPRFLENLQAILSDEGAVNLECKVIGVPQPVLKWYKDGEELKPGDIHRIISGQDGTCCLGTYTCEAQNCMGIAASSASLLGFEDTVKAKKKRADDQILQRNLSLSTIHEERTSQMYDTPVADVTLDEKGEISFSFDGKEVSVSLYETPDLTEEEALQIVEMYADQLSENVTEHNVIELPPLRFVKETSTSGNLLMEAIIIDVSPDYFVPPEEDLRTEADIEDISIAEENGQQQLSFDQEVAEEYIDKTMALLSDEKSDIVLKPVRRKSDSHKSGEDYFSLSRDQSISEEKKDDDTQILSESISFASAHSTGKQKSKPSQEDDVGTQESSDITKTVFLREELRTSLDIENKSSKLVGSAKRDSLKSISSFKQEEVDFTNLNENMICISLSLSKILNNVEMLERDIILQSQLMPTAAIASKSLEIINSIISPLTEIHSITDVFKESMNETSDAKPILLTKLPQCLKDLQNSLAMVEKCVDVGSDKTLINNTCISILNNCEEDMTKFVEKIREIPEKYPYLIDETASTEIKLLSNDILNIINIAKSTVNNKSKLNQETHKQEISIDKQHLNNTQKAIYHLKVPLNSLWDIIENALKKSLLSYNETNNAEAILFNMSSSIQDLQTALEQIEFLSVEESNSSLPKYNTTTIETVISSVLKLRNSFESLSFEKEKKYDKEQLGSVLQVIKVDLEDISFRINDIEKTIGSFDVLYGDNKLEILQRMAHVLIALENSLPVLNSLPNVQTTLSAFHKNLTKALENAIESNESAKYSALLHICDVVSRINVSIKGFESSKFISLTSILNNFNIIEENLKSLSIDQGIREDILKNVYQCYVDIQNVITTYAEDMSIKMDSEPVEDISTDQFYTESKANLVVQHIDQVIAAINNVSAEEVTPSLCCILPILQNTCPVLEELKCSIASLEENIQENSHVSEIISQSLLAQSIETPLQSIQENITVLNQVLLDTVGETNSKDDAIGVFAKPLYELYTTLQTLQENVLSEYESFSLSENSAKIATSTEVLRNCILIVEEKCFIEGLDEMSTLQDISCLKTTADPISGSNLILPVIQETHLEAPIFYTLKSRPEIAHEFQLLHDDILEIQKLDILEALNALSEVKEYANLKSVTETIEEIQHKIVSILSPLVMESLSSVSNLDLASNNLTNISESLFKLKNHLTVIDLDNIPIYEDVLMIPSNKIHYIVKNISNLKEHLDKCILSVQRHTNLLDSEEIKDLYYVCNDFLSCSKTTVQKCPSQNENMYNLVSSVENFLQVIRTTPDLNAEEVKSVFNDLYKSIMNMEDTLFEYVSPTEITVTKENPLETKIHKLANNIAALEHYNADLSGASNTDFPQSASLTSIETEYLNNMESVLVHNAIIMQNLTNESQITELQNKDIIFIRNFMEKLKNSFSIIRVLLTQRPSHKRVIRLFQEYFTLQINIYKFKNEKSTHPHPEDFTYLEDFFNQAEGSLDSIKLSLIKLCSSISKTLFREPLTKIIDSIANFPNYLQLDSIIDLHDLIQNFLIIVNIASPHLESLEQNVVQELETCIFINSDAENKLITDSLDNFLSLLEREMGDNPDNEKEKLLKEMIKCFRNHQDYKKAVGTGKRMIILKFLADCSDILRNHFRTFDTEIKLLESTNHFPLQNSLTKFIQQLKSLHLQINKMQENVCMYPKDVVPDLMIKNIASLKQFCEKHLNVFSQSSLCEDDFCLINDIIHEIHLIQDNINSLQNDLKILEDLKNMEDFFKKMLSSDEVTKDHKLSKAETKSILQHVEQYIEVTEIIEEISAIINLGNVKKTKEIAQELRESLAADNAQSMDAAEELKYCTVSENQENLAQRLQISLSNIRESELLSCDTHIRKHILDVITKLQDDLNTIATTETLAGCASINKISQDPGIEICEKSCHNIGLLSISIDQECTAQDPSIKKHNEKTNTIPVIHQIEDTISSISGIISEEISIDAKNIYPALENICPILEELKLNVATLQENIERTESPISDISDSPVQKAFSKPLRDLEENIIVLNHLILESLKGTTENENLRMLGVLAKPLHELHITYQILQENVISQYESLSCLQPNINFAATEQILHSCVLLVQEPYEVEIADEMSTLEDISCIKTNADSISSDVLAVAQDMQVTSEEYYTSHKQNESEFNKLPTQQEQTQTIIKENISVSIEQPLKLEHAISQETIVSIDEDNNALKKNQVSREELIRNDDDQLKFERAIEPDTIDKDINTTETNLTEIIKEYVEPNNSDQIIQAPTQECHDDQLKTERAIDEDIKKTETKLTEIIKECVKPKNDSDQKIEVTMQEYIETTEENISVPIDQPFVLAQDTQATLEESIDTGKTNISSSYDDQLKSERAIEPDTIDEDIKKTETNLTEIIKECVKPKKEAAKVIEIPINENIELGNAYEIQATLEQTVETTEENISSPITPEVDQERRITVEENLKQNDKLISELTDEPYVAENPITQKSHAPDDCKDRITNVEYMNQKCTDMNYNLKYNSIIQTMEALLNELHEILMSSDATNVEKTDYLQNMLDEFQVQIIKLKSMNIKDASDILNETIDDLECSVRSVQLLINESSPTDHVIEASATIELLVNSIKEDLSKMHFQDTMLGKPDILEECVGDTETTLLLLDAVSETITNHDNILKIINDLNTVKDSMKTIKLSFSIDEETVIEKGIEILESLDIIEHQLFTIEDVIEKMPTVDLLTRDTIITAVHSVYTNISNIRGTISNIKKSYIYQNYGKPSENLLKAIKNINYIKNIDNNHNWISVTKHFRNILNHFEEIKFYINLDKTARQPSDASLTKVVLNELKLLLSNDVLNNTKEFQSLLGNSVDTVIEFIVECIHKIDRAPVLEVREKIPIFKELTGRLIDLSNEILDIYKHVNTINVDTNVKEPQTNEISSSESQYELDKTIILESPNLDCMEVTVVQPISALNNLVSHIITESSFSKDDTPPDIEMQTVKYNNIEKQLIKDGVQPIIEQLIEEAINKVTLLSIQNGNIQEFGNKDDLQMLQEPHDHTSKILLDAKTIELKSKTTTFESMIAIDNKQNVAKDSQIDQQIKNILSCEEENIMLHVNIGSQTEIDRLDQDLSEQKVKKSDDNLGDDEQTSSLKDLSKKDFCINNKLGNDISEEDIKRDSRSQNIKLKCLDENKLNKNKQEITSSNMFNVSLERNEDLKKDVDNQTNKQHEASKETIDENCKNIQEKSLILKRSENKEMNTLDTQIQDSLIGTSTTKKQDSEIKSITDEDSSLPDVLDEKLEVVEKMKSEMESKDHQNDTDITRSSAEISRQELGISDIGIEKVLNLDVTTEENNKILDNQSLQDKDILQPQLNKDDDQNEIEDNSNTLNKVSKSLLNQTHLNFDENSVIEEGRRKFPTKETLNEGNTKEQQKDIKTRPFKLNLQQQQLMTVENFNLNYDKAEITSNVELQATVSEQNITDLQKIFKNVTLSNNLVDKNDLLVIQDQNTSNEHVQSIDIEVDNSTFISGDKQESILEINIISQNDTNNLLSPEEIKICPSIQESYVKEIIFETSELKEKISSLVPEQNQQNKGSRKHDEDTAQHATYNEPTDANTTATKNTSLSAKSGTTIDKNSQESLAASSDTKEWNLDREIENNVNEEESICQFSQSRETIEPSSLRANTQSDTRDEICTVKKKKRTQSKLKTNGLSKKLTTKEDDIEKDKSNDIQVYERTKIIIDDDARLKKQDDSDTLYGVTVSRTLSTLNAEILDNKNVKTEMNQPQSIDINTENQTTMSKDVKTTPYTVKEKPQFIDPNFVDASMGFLRPPTYISKPFEAENFLTPELNTYTSSSNVFYKAQSLIRDHQSKSMYTGDREKQLETQLSTKATNESRSIYSEKRASSTRDLKRKPVFTTHLTNRTAVEGSRVKLTCSVLSSTEPVLKWYKNGVLLEDKHKYKIKFIDGLITMELLNALPSDSGDYSCTVDNEHGSITTSAKLKVYPSFEASPIPPTFTRSIRDVYHRAENELILECRIRGQPIPIISWFKDNKPIATDDRYEASYLADGLCRLTINSPSKEDSGTYTCKAESAVWSDQITHVVNFADATRLDSHISSVERLRLRHDTRRPHFTNVLSDYKVIKGGTIGLQVEIGGAPTKVEWLREGSPVTELDKNAQTFVDHGIYTLALNDVSERHSGLYTCRAWSMHGNVDMNAEISVVQPNEVDGRPAVIVSRPTKDVLISVGEDINISFRVQGEPRPKVFFLKGIRDITNSQRVCKMTSDDYVKFTMKRSVISDAGTYCILARNVYGCDRAFVTVAVRQRASSDNLISDWTYSAEDPIIATERKYKSVPGRIPGKPSAVDGGNNWVALSWPKSDPQEAAPVLAYRVDSWLLGKEGGARWIEMGITPRNTFDAFNLKQGEEYHFRVTPRNRYGWGEPVQTSTPIAVGIAGDRPEFIDILPGLLKVLVGETANLSCSFKGKPTPVIAWMKNGREIDESGKVRSRQNGNVCSLTIKNVEIEDEGRYSCEATNVHGRASTYARMTVITDRQIWEADAKLKRERSADATGEYPPQFTMRLRDRRVQATYPVRLTFQVIGSPTPNVTWFKDGQEITFDSRKTSYKDEHFHTLEIAPTTLDDGGLYEALARNNSGAVSCRCSLVVDKGIRAYVAPEFCCGLEPLYRINEGDELRISAIVEAYPSVGVTWYRDGVRLRPSRRAIMTLDRDGQIELALASVTPRDAGVYTCTASNEVGQASTSGKVEIVTDQREERRNVPTVICPDIPYSKEPMFIMKPRSTEAQEGDTVIIECEVIGDPTPEVYWLRDFLKPDYYRDAKHFKQMAAGPLYRFEIPHAKLDFTGAYSVVARNVHGEAKAIISLQIFAKDLSSSDETHNIRYGRVEVIPRFEKELTDLLCYDSDAIEFECLISGHPEPDIRWFHYNQLLPDCPDFESTYDLGTARLKIKQVAAEDEGTYTCEASNNLGKATSTACLVVYPPGEPNTISQRLQRPPALASAASTPRSTPRVTPARSVSRTPALSGPESHRLRSPTREVGPKFYTYPFNKVVEEGDSVVLQCAVGGFPTPWATWDKDSIIITPTSRISVKEKDEMLRILQIDEVNIDDVGLYRITLENDFGRAEASARLEVISHKGKFHSRSSSVSPARLYRRRTPSFTRQD